MRSFAVAIMLAALMLGGQVSAQSMSPGDIPIEEFGALPKNSNVTLSPDGEYVAIKFFYKGKNHVMLKPFGGKNADQKPVVIPPYKKMDINWVSWANNDYLLISMWFDVEEHAALGKVTGTRLISIKRDNPDKPKNMARPARVKGSREMGDGDVLVSLGNDNIIDMLPEDPEHFLLAIDEDQVDSSLEVRKVEVATGNYRVVQDFYADIQGWTTDQSGKLRLGEGFRRVGASMNDEVQTMFYLPPGESEWVEYTEGETSKYSIAGFFEDPRYAYAVGPNDEGYATLYKYDMVAQEIIEEIFSVDGYDVGSLRWDRHTGKPVGIRYTTTKQEIHYFDSELARLQRMLDQAMPGSINILSSWTKDRKKFIVRVESDVDSGSYYLFDTTTKQMMFIEAAYAGLDPRLLAPMKPVEYETRDGLMIPGYLTLPTGVEAKNLPTVILPHGGPQARDVWGYDFLPQFLASRGYAVLQPNFRGSTGYGKDFADAGRREWGLKMQDDVTDGAQWLVAEGIADPERMCIMGWSYGGYSALIGIVKTPTLFKCSISINGVSDLSMLMYDDSNFLGLRKWGSHIGDRDEDKERLKANSAYHNIHKIRVPVLLIANRDDTRVNYKQSKKFADEMQDAGKYAKYVEIEEGGHSALQGQGRTIILREVEAFLARYIGSGN